jgi:hypothetical protein
MRRDTCETRSDQQRVVCCLAQFGKNIVNLAFGDTLSTNIPVPALLVKRMATDDVGVDCLFRVQVLWRRVMSVHATACAKDHV